MCVSISRSNSKLGQIPSVSLPAWITCRKCGCWYKCYARKIERLRPNVRNAYAKNLYILRNDPTTYWREVEAAIMMSRFFRFHVSGDIPDADYLYRMIKVADRNKHCQILCFTKKFEIVNSIRTEFGKFPENLHIIFSAWENLDMPNYHNFPEAHVRFRNGFTTARQGAIECSGNCSECACTDGGCWNLQSGQQVVFNEH